MYSVYIYSDAFGSPFYIGKGQGRRHTKYLAHLKQQGIPVPNKSLIQVFWFDTKQEAWDTEINLIDFFKRKCDGGALLNKALGGPGCSGYVYTAEQRKRISDSLKGKYTGSNHFASKHYLITHPDGLVEQVHGLAEFARKHNLYSGHLTQVAKGKRSHHKGYKCSRI